MVEACADGENGQEGTSCDRRWQAIRQQGQERQGQEQVLAGLREARQGQEKEQVITDRVSDVSDMTPAHSYKLQNTSQDGNIGL